MKLLILLLMTSSLSLATVTNKDIEAGVFKVKSDNGGDTWTVLGSRWKWMNDYAFDTKNSKQVSKLISLVLKSKQKISKKKILELLNENDNLFMMNALLVLAGNHGSTSKFTLSHNDGKWTSISLADNIICTSDPIYCTRGSKKLSSIQAKNAIKGFFNEFKARNLLSFCNAVKSNSDPIFAQYKKKALKEKTRWKSLGSYCKSIIKTFSLLKKH